MLDRFVGRCLQTDQALLRLGRPLAQPVLLRLGGSRRRQDVRRAGLLVPAVLPVLLVGVREFGWGREDEVG